MVKPTIDLKKNAANRKNRGTGLDAVFENPNTNVNNDNSNDSSTNTDESTNTDVTENTSVNNDADEITSSDINNDTDVTVNNDVNVYTNTSESNSASKSTNKNVNNSTNIIVIKKTEKVEEPKRNTYYLKPSTHKKLQKLADKADKGVSEFLQELLDGILDSIEIK